MGGLSALGKPVQVHPAPGERYPYVGEYLWTEVGRVVILRPVAIPCPFCHELLGEFETTNKPSGRVTQIDHRSGLAMLDLLPETHTPVGCNHCRMVFTVLTEAFEAAR